mgnify:CR=1 FL=1
MESAAIHSSEVHEVDSGIPIYSPPYKPEFSDEDNKAIIDAINAANLDLLWIGMTAPKQEKWTYSHWNELNIHCHVVPSVPSSTSLLVPWSVPLSGGRSMVWNGSID